MFPPPCRRRTGRIRPAPWARRPRRAAQIARFMQDVRKTFPAGIRYTVSYDSTMFVRAAIKDVAVTLLEAIGLVLLVVFVFLQNWRATLIPLLTIPVAVVGLSLIHISE